MIKAKSGYLFWKRNGWKTHISKQAKPICGASIGYRLSSGVDSAEESEICQTCLKVARKRGLIEEVPEHTKPVQDPIKAKLHEYECRAKNAEDEVAEMRAKVERSKKREADTYAMFERENKKRVEAVRKVDDVEKENRRLKNSDRALLDTIAKIDREHAERVAGLEKDIDKMMPAYEAIEHVKDQRNQARSELVELRSQIIEIEKAFDSLCCLNQDLLSATKGHTLENITTIMQAAPSAEDLEGKLVSVSHSYKDGENHMWIQLQFTPIIEYIPTEEIVDALIDELGRIECEVCNNLSSNKGWIPSILIQVESDVEYAYETPKGGKHDMRWWNQCRIRKDTIESLRGSK